MKSLHVLIGFILLLISLPIYAQETAEEAKQYYEQAKKVTELKMLLEKEKGLKELKEQYRLSEEDEESIRSFYNEFNKGILKELDQLQNTDPKQFEFQLRHLYFDKMMLERIRDEEPDRFKEAIRIRELNVRSIRLSEEYHSADEGDKSKIENELSDVLNELFDLRENEKKAEMERIETKLNKLSEEISKRRENKEIIVKNRLRELIGENKVYEW